MMVLVCAVGVTGTKSQIPETQSTVNRTNYGVIFKNEGQISISKEYWLHTFKIDIPKHMYLEQYSLCNVDTVCAVFNDYIKSLNYIHSKTEENTNKTIKHIHALVPNSNTLKTMKAKRAILSFVGSLSKTLFGTATMDDVNILARHINQLTRTTL